MPVRRATRRWEDLGSFLQDWQGTLHNGAVFLPAGAVDGELAPELKLDLELPLVGRVGPVRAQVVHRMPDGGVGLQLPDLRAEAGDAIDTLLGVVASVKEHLLAQGEVVLPGHTASLEARVAELEEALAAARAAPSEAGDATTQASAAPAAPTRPEGRGFPVPAVQEDEPTLSGPLGDRSLPDALLQIAVQRWTGLLTCRLGDGRVRYGFFNKGGPVGFRTDPVQESEVLGVLLYKAEQIDKAQLAESLDRMQRTGQRQGEAFIDMGLMTFSQLIMVLGKQAEFVFSKMLTEADGDWAFHKLDALPEQFLPPPVRMPSLMYRTLLQRARTMPAKDLALSHRDRIDRYIQFRGEMVPLLADIQFDANERKLLGVMRSNTWRMREVFSVSPVSRQATAAILWALVEMGFLAFERSEDRERYLKRVTEMVRRKKRQLAKCTHFDVLEIHWISLPNEIREGYERLRTHYDPAQFEDLPQELIDGLIYVRSRLDESWALLSNDERRREYRKELIEPVMIGQSAELLGKKGEMAIMRKDRREATTCFAKALELMPGHPSFREGMQRARSAL